MDTPMPSSAGGRSGPAILCRKAIGHPGRPRPGLGRRCRTARRTAGRPTRLPPASKRRSTPFRDGLLAGSDPAAEGRMGMYIAILPDADRGMPRWGVAPSHGLDGRIGIAAPAAVAQPPARQRHTEPAACPSQTRSCVRRPPKHHVHSWIGIGTGARRSKRVPPTDGSNATTGRTLEVETPSGYAFASATTLWRTRPPTRGR